MGILLDTRFWAEKLNQLASLHPGLGQPISREKAAEIRRIACLSLSALLDDGEFADDLARAIDLAKNAPTINANTPNFEEFINAFALSENKILEDAGVDSIASRDLEREIRTVARVARPSSVDRLYDKITFLRKLACDPNAAEDPKKPFWVAVWRGVKGVGAIGIDLGAVAASGAAFSAAGAAVSAQIVSYSITYGAELVDDALKGRW